MASTTLGNRFDASAQAGRQESDKGQPRESAAYLVQASHHGLILSCSAAFERVLLVFCEPPAA